ncbi:acyl-CoA synthetase [Sphingomonas bacterium]|uniref:acyl-CoA synthetase n=1 Tax=Sphingomonas bacterium TaxID=1895847 RepID=UPI00261243AA|nr:acyl-CoA synthetase [Sphingomonas bacterium]MDB5679558.1 acyl-CoA synthetase [Sphingomonas bacterium]
MHPSVHAKANPDKPALIVAETGAVMTYAELDAASNRAAQLYRAHGLIAGDRIALFLENIPDWFALVWGAQRSGLLFVAVSSKLTAAEVDYILADSGAKMLVADAALGHVASALTTPIERFAVGGAILGFADWHAASAAMPDTPIADESAGAPMLYSSGTTGRPKGIVPPPGDKAIDTVPALAMIAQGFFGLGADTVYLSTAPLYHAAPLAWTTTVQRLGGTVVMMAKFDAEAAISAIERYRCNAGQFVPTHFVRMLKLPEAVRARYDLSSMKVAIHAAAPCPVPVKRAMIDWWGPVIDEYYAGSEGNGFTAIKAAAWLDRPGSVGHAIGEATLHICDEEGNELPPRREGLVYFKGQRQFEYHNDPAKTAESRNRHGWTTLGDVGWVDEDGFLYLTDRKSFMIISGGVNIYPQEIENRIITHPRVADVAVIGAPDPEMGERVVAVVQPVDMAEAGPALVEEITAWCRAELSGIKTPRQIDFTAELPRHATGKLYKRLLRDQYWGNKESRIV